MKLKKLQRKFICVYIIYYLFPIEVYENGNKLAFKRQNSTSLVVFEVVKYKHKRCVDDTNLPEGEKKSNLKQNGAQFSLQFQR